MSRLVSRFGKRGARRLEAADAVDDAAGVPDGVADVFTACAFGVDAGADDAVLFAVLFVFRIRDDAIAVVVGLGTGIEAGAGGEEGGSECGEQEGWFHGWMLW